MGSACKNGSEKQFLHGQRCGVRYRPATSVAYLALPIVQPHQAVLGLHGQETSLRERERGWSEVYATKMEGT